MVFEHAEEIDSIQYYLTRCGVVTKVLKQVGLAKEIVAEGNIPRKLLKAYESLRAGVMPVFE